MSKWEKLGTNIKGSYGRSFIARTARKLYFCKKCHIRIEEGDRYISVKDVISDSRSGIIAGGRMKFCLVCGLVYSIKSGQKVEKLETEEKILRDELKYRGEKSVKEVVEREFQRMLEFKEDGEVDKWLQHS